MMRIYKKIIPTYFYEDVYKINYINLKEQGIKTLFFDLDNTLISYNQIVITNKVLNLLNELSKDFNIVILSNNNFKRVNLAVGNYGFNFVHHALKPLKKGFKKALKVYSNTKDEVIVIGDQLMTDILGASKFKIKSILVKPIEVKSDVFTTRINRRIQKIFVNKLKKKDIYTYERLIYPYEQ